MKTISEHSKDNNNQSKLFSLTCKGTDVSGFEVLDEAVKIMLDVQRSDEHPNDLVTIVHCNYLSDDFCTANPSHETDPSYCPYVFSAIGGPTKREIQSASPTRDAATQSSEQEHQKPFIQYRDIRDPNQLLETLDFKLTPFKDKFVITKTHGEFRTLMRVYEFAGWKWNDGDLPRLGYDLWKTHQENTCVEVCDEFMYDHIESCVGEDLLFLDAFLEKQNITPSMANALNHYYFRLESLRGDVNE